WSSTPASTSPASASSAKSSSPTAPTSRTRAPIRAAATAWFAPFPPGKRRSSAPLTVSPSRGSRSTRATRSRLIDPTTVSSTGTAASVLRDGGARARTLGAVDADAVEIRVLGCLIEKQRTTPDVYPLSVNALRLACNQSTNRDPVVAYDEPTIRNALDR